MNKEIKIESRYYIAKDGDTSGSMYITQREALDALIDIHHDRIDEEIMSREEVKRDNLEGYDQSACDEAWKQVEQEILEYGYDDGNVNGHWAIVEQKVVVDRTFGHTDELDTIELDDDDHLYGEVVITEGGDYIAVRRLDGGIGSACTAVYEAISVTDGHHDVLVSDNATVWVLGDEDDPKRNAEMFATIKDIHVYWTDIEDCDLSDWIEARRAEAEAYSSKCAELAAALAEYLGGASQATALAGTRWEGDDDVDLAQYCADYNLSAEWAEEADEDEFNSRLAEVAADIID